MIAAVPPRRFTLRDQLAFARLSGDHNPIHVDPVEARRLLFGGPIVHGIHLVLWSLDRLAAAGHRVEALSRLEAKFDSAVLLDADVAMDVPEMISSAMRVRLRSARRLAMRLRVDCVPLPEHWRNPGPPPHEPCRELDAAEIATAVDTVPLGFDRDELTALFPA